ncbi:MAG: hypothetical protein RJP96_11745, partial [Algiphilus sp.]
PNFRDTDDDGDNIPTLTEGIIDTDLDLTPNYLDTDSDNDGNPDLVEGTGDVDGDLIPNYIDPDDSNGPLADLDGDGLSNGDELTLGTNPLLADSDLDGIDDFVETNGGSAINTDGDLLIDALDVDSDNDLVLDALE